MKNVNTTDAKGSVPAVNNGTVHHPEHAVQDNTALAIGKLFSAAEAADALGFRRKNTVYEIPECDLPRTRVGPRRGRTMFRGEDLIAYMAAGRNAL